MKPAYTDLQLDALREVANIGSGTAGTALSSMIGRSVDISVPTAEALALADAVDAVGASEELITALVLPLFGDLEALALLLFAPEDAATLCGLLGVEADTEVGQSALGEIGNILGTSYINSLCAMTGLRLEPGPPQVIVDMLGAIVASALADRCGEYDIALLLDSELRVEGEPCSITFMLLPTPEGVSELLTRLGVGE